VKAPTRKCRGTTIEGVKRLEERFRDDVKRWSHRLKKNDLELISGYWLCYPLFLELVGHKWREDEARRAAYEALNIAHPEATRQLMELAKSFGIDSRALWESSSLCQQLFRYEPWKYYPPDCYSMRPDCLDESLVALSERERQVVRRGEATLVQLFARAKIQPKAPIGYGLEEPNLSTAMVKSEYDAYLGIEVHGTKVHRNERSVDFKRNAQPLNLFVQLLKAASAGKEKRTLMGELWDTPKTENAIDQLKLKANAIIEPLGIEIDADGRGVWRLVEFSS